jgi:hypothetical protein
LGEQFVNPAFDADENMFWIVFNSESLDLLWNAGGVSSSIFAKKFADAYKIPQFESKVDDEINHYWFYQDPKIGFKVEIYTSGQDPETDVVNRVVMQKIQKAGDTKFDD